MEPLPFAHTLLPISAALIAGVAGATYLAKPLRYFKYANIKNLDQIRKLSPKHFEEYLVFSFTKMGYAVEVVSRSTNGDVEIMLKRNGKLRTVMCNAWTGRTVPVSEIRDEFEFFEERAYVIKTKPYILDDEGIAYVRA